jgi:8-oxo-dGTP pyrophosphatase MutT (NUDIX family)
LKQIELFDAIGADEKRLGFDLNRDEPIAESAFHYVVEIYCFDRSGRILVTKRASEKKYPLLWEVTSGSVVKGETAIDGAIRELKEETGLAAQTGDLRLISTIVKHPAIYKTYVACLGFAPEDIRLQKGETIDFRLLDMEDFAKLLSSDAFVGTLARRYLAYQSGILAFYRSICLKLVSGPHPSLC